MLLTRFPVLYLLAICCCIVFWLLCPHSCIVQAHVSLLSFKHCSFFIFKDFRSSIAFHFSSEIHLSFFVPLLYPLFSLSYLCGRPTEDLCRLLQHFPSQTRHQIDCTTLGQFCTTAGLLSCSTLRIFCGVFLVSRFSFSCTVGTNK